MRFDLNEGFPLVTTKKVHLKSIILELLWFLKGSSDNNWLKERGVSVTGTVFDLSGGPVAHALVRASPILQSADNSDLPAVRGRCTRLHDRAP